MAQAKTPTLFIKHTYDNFTNIKAIQVDCLQTTTGIKQNTNTVDTKAKHKEWNFNCHERYMRVEYCCVRSLAVIETSSDSRACDFLTRPMYTICMLVIHITKNNAFCTLSAFVDHQQSTEYPRSIIISIKSGLERNRVVISIVRLTIIIVIINQCVRMFSEGIMLF